MNSIHVPFDFSPFSTEIKTSGYTVPAGYRARVKALSDDFTIDTVSPMLIDIKSVHAIGSSGHFYLVGEPGPYFVQMVQSSGTGLGYEFYWVSGALSHQLNSSSGLDMSNLAGINVAAIPTTSQGAGAIYVKVTWSGAPSALQMYLYKRELDWTWVKTGTALAGSRYVVELYANQG